MEIIETKDNKIIRYENGVAQVFDVDELKAQKKDIQKRLEADKSPSDEELLAWAKVNYPFVDHSLEITELERVNKILEEIK